MAVSKDPKVVNQPNKPQFPPAEQNVADEAKATGLPITPQDKQRAFGGPDFAVIPEDIPGREGRQARREDAKAAADEEAEKQRAEEKKREDARR